MKAGALVILAIVTASCSGPTPAAPPPCDLACQDRSALRAMREMVKLAFNLTLQGKPVGDHDETIPCIRGGSARVFGRATSNPVQGATEVHLTYVLDSCAYVQNDVDAAENYDMTLTGTIIQDGVLAVQPTATTALRFTSESLTWSGTVSDPPTPYEAPACVVDLQQNGNLVAGMLCGRTASFTF